MSNEIIEPVTHVIFDCDGLLVNSEYFYHEALKKVCSKYGKEFTFEIKCEMMGTKPIEGAILCLNRLELTGQIEPEKFVAEYEEVMKENCSKITFMPGAKELIQYLDEHNVPMAIATGSSKAGFERKTGHLGDILRKPFKHHVFAGSDPEVKLGKPHPDVFQVAANRFEDKPISAKNCLVFEDAINGVKAAQAAGMQVVFVPDKWTNPALIDKKPTLTLKSLTEFDPKMFGLCT